MSNSIPTTRIDYCENLPKHFMKGLLLCEPEALDEAIDYLDIYDELRIESGVFSPADINMMVDMCRVDGYFKPCLNGDWTSLNIDTFDFVILAWERVARLAHTFWGIQSHFAALGIDSNEDLSIDFVKRAVSALIKEENKAKNEAKKTEENRIAELTEQAA